MLETQFICKGKTDAVSGKIEICMCGIDSDSIFYKLDDQFSNRVGAYNGRRGSEKQGMVCNDQFSFSSKSLINNSGCNLKRNKHFCYPPLRAADLEAYIVVLLRSPARCPIFQYLYKLRDDHKKKCPAIGRDT